MTSSSNSNKKDVIYSSYKYEDIKSEWIIHEGNLEYLYAETMFKTLLFKSFYTVLTYVLNEKLIRLYLYLDKTKSPYKYFQLDENDEFNDRCRKVIEGHPGLFFMELILKTNDKGHIFATRSNPERKLWLHKFDEAMSKLNSKIIIRQISETQSIRSNSTSEECSPPVQSHPINYVPFGEDGSNKNASSDFSATPQSVEPINEYEEVDVVLPTDLNKNEIFSWEQIFYDNINDDFMTVLNNAGQSGVFLIRPQSKKSTSNDHEYTLCIYDNAHIHKFAIHQLPDHKYQLIYRTGEPRFINISELCQYYTNNALHITLRDGFTKRVYLTYSYTNANLYD